MRETRYITKDITPYKAIKLTITLTHYQIDIKNIHSATNQINI